MQLEKVLRQIDWLQAEKTPGSLLLVGIGGHGGSGKTTLANAIGKAVPNTEVVSTDSFWNGELFDLERLRTEVIDVLASNKTATIGSFEMASSMPRPTRTIRPRNVVIIEGVCALHQMFRNQFELRVWVDTPAGVRLQRGVARDGEGSRDQWENVWMRNESAYVQRDRPIESAHMIVDGTKPY